MSKLFIRKYASSFYDLCSKLGIPLEDDLHPLVVAECDDVDEWEHKGAFCGLNYDSDKLAYIAKPRLSRFDLSSFALEPTIDTENRDKRQSLAVQTTVRKSLTACGIVLAEEYILKLEQHFSDASKVRVEHIETGIGDIYSLPRPENRSSLGCSCMQEKPSEWFQLYDENSNIGCFVAYNNESEFVGRALTWKTRCGKLLCDRRYGINSYVEEAIANHAKSQGYYIKSNNNYDYPNSWIGLNDEFDHRSELMVDLEVGLSVYAPYLDTFYHYNDNHLSTDCGFCELRSTSGYFMSCRCDDCGDYVHEDDITTVDGNDYCCGCVDDHSFVCDCCNERYHNDMRNHVAGDASVCDGCLANHYTRCDECEEYHPEDEVRYYSNTEVSICDDCR